MFVLIRIKESNLEHLVMIFRCDHVNIFYYVTHNYDILSHHWFQPLLRYLINKLIFIHAMEYLVVIVYRYLLNLTSFFISLLDVVERVGYHIKIVM